MRSELNHLKGGQSHVSQAEVFLTLDTTYCSLLIMLPQRSFNSKGDLLSVSISTKLVRSACPQDVSHDNHDSKFLH